MMEKEPPAMASMQGSKASLPMLEKTISFVVPCLNERENIARTIVEIERAVQEVGIREYEILVVDDYSSDDTSGAVRTIMRERSHLQLMRSERRLGFGGAYKEGLKHATLNYTIMIPGDNSFPADGIAAILREAGKSDIIVPYRDTTDVRPWYRSGASVGFTSLVNVLFGLKLPYYNGPVLHRTDLLKKIDIQTDGFAYACEALVKLLRRGASYSVIGITIQERNEGRSTALKPRTIFGVIKALISLWFSERFGRAI